MLTINEFSKQTEFSIRMLRYLEEMKVLIPNRGKNNYRLYNKTQIDEAKKIKKLQSFGIQLKEVESLQISSKPEQIEILKNVLQREIEIAELKSNSVFQLKDLVCFLESEDNTIEKFFEHQKEKPVEINIVGNDKKIQRRAYNIPILRNIYEDHLAYDTNIDLIATDLITFNTWFKNFDYSIKVYSVLNSSSFVFGNNLTDSFIDGYEVSWNKFLPKMNFEKLEKFEREDIGQFMGPHDILIRTIFKYKDNGESGEILIPYAPVYTLSQIR